MNKTSNYTKTKSKKRIALACIAAILVLGVSYLAYAQATQSVWPFIKEQPKQDEPRSTNDINYDPPSETDIEQSQLGKQNNDNRNDSPPTDNTSQKSVDIGISFADLINNKAEVRAFIANVIEGNGSCTVTATKGELSVVKSSPAFIDASSTQCTPIYIDRSEFPEYGTWNITVSYNSPTSKGVSEEVKINL